MDFDIRPEDGFPWDKVDAAKRYLYAIKPWWARFGEHLKVVPVYQPPTGTQPYGATMSTDRQFRLYIDRGYALAKPLHILAGAIEHQFQHHTRNTFNRLRHLSDEDWAEWANISFGLEINSGMDVEQRTLSMEDVQIALARSAVFTKREAESWGVEAPPGLEDAGWLPRIVGVPDGMSAEEYVAILKKAKEDQEKREQEEQEPEPKEQEQEEPEEQGGQEGDDPAEPESEQPENDEPVDEEDVSGDQEDQEQSEDQQDGDGSEDEDADGADSESGEDAEDDSESSDEEGGGDSGGEDAEGDQENSGATSSDPKKDEEAEGDQEGNDASNGDTDLSDGGESDGSEDDEPEPDADAEESAANDTGSAGGNHSSDQKGKQESDSEGETGNASQEQTSGGEPGTEGEELSDPDQEGTGDPGGEGGELVPGEESSDREMPTMAEIADVVDALREKLDPRLWAKEQENPTDELTALPWKPEDRENEKPVSRTEIGEAMISLEEDVMEAQGRPGFGLQPGTQMVNWVFRQRKVRGVDWQSRLSKLMTAAYTSVKVSGASDLSYSVRNPNQQEFGPILQGLHDYAPNIMVIQDVSASMRNGNRQSIAMSAFTELATKVLGTFNTSVTWVTVDTDIIDVGQASGWSKHMHRRMSYGFGGTKIGPVIAKCMNGTMSFKGKKYPKPDILIVVTDCGFDWPEIRPTKRGKLLVASVETNISNLNFFLPKWLNRKQELVIMK